MCDEGEGEKRKGPSIQTLSWGAVISVLSLLASGVASYNDVKNEIAALKRGESYQERVNDGVVTELRNLSSQIRENDKRYSDKLDSIIYHLSGRK